MSGAFVFIAFNIFGILGFAFGYILRGMVSLHAIEIEEKGIYCHGFEDGLYYTLGEYRPELFKKEFAERSYHEYRMVKHGQQKH